MTQFAVGPDGAVRRDPQAIEQPVYTRLREEETLN